LKFIIFLKGGIEKPCITNEKGSVFRLSCGLSLKIPITCVSEELFMRKTIFLTSDLHRRDTNAMIFFKEWIMAEYPEVNVYVPSRINVRILSRFFFKAVWIFSPHQFLALKKKHIKKLSKGTICIIETEGFVDAPATLPLFDNKDYYEYVDLIFVWGQRSKDLVTKEIGIPEQKVKIVGSPRLPLLLPATEPNPKNIGVIGKHEMISSFNKRSHIKIIYNSVVNDEVKLAMTNRLEGDIGSLIYIFERIPILAKNGYEISIRPHPNEYFKDYSFFKRIDNIRVSDQNEDYCNWLKKQRFVFSPISTTCIDLYLLQIPSFEIKVNDEFENKEDCSFKYFKVYSKKIYGIQEIEDFIKNHRIDKFVENEDMNDVLKLHFNNGITNYRLIIESILSIDKGLYIPTILIKLVDFLYFFRRFRFGFKKHAAFNYSYISFVHKDIKADRELLKLVREHNGTVDVFNILKSHFNKKRKQNNA